MNGKVFEHRPIKELISIVKGDLKKLNDEGLIDEGSLIKTIMWCNDRLGIPIREVKQISIPVENYEASLPIDFEKLYYVCALNCTNTHITTALQNPFNNTFDRDVIYDAKVNRECIGNTDHYQVVINKTVNTQVVAFHNWIDLSISPSSFGFCHEGCPNMTRPGKYQISIVNDKIETPFKKGELYLMYLGNMKDEDGNLLFPFHPLITPWYEWALKEKVIMDAIFNSEGNYGDLLKLSQLEKSKAWLDAFNFTTERSYGEYIQLQRQKELKWYTQYFSIFQ